MVDDLRVSNNVLSMKNATMTKSCHSRVRNADKGISDGLECVSGKLIGFHGAAAEQELLEKLSGREVRGIHRWGRAFDGEGHGLHAENAGPHQGL